MCKAFSCIVDQVGKVTWKLGMDSHSALARLGGYEDRVLGEFAKIEITPWIGGLLIGFAFGYYIAGVKPCSPTAAQLAEKEQS